MHTSFFCLIWTGIKISPLYLNTFKAQYVAEVKRTRHYLIFCTASRMSRITTFRGCLRILYVTRNDSADDISSIPNSEETSKHFSLTAFQLFHFFELWFFFYIFFSAQYFFIGFFPILLHKRISKARWPSMHFMAYFFLVCASEIYCPSALQPYRNKNRRYSFENLKNFRLRSLEFLKCLLSKWFEFSSELFWKEKDIRMVFHVILSRIWDGAVAKFIC